jgi:hypothetical protein
LKVSEEKTQSHGRPPNFAMFTRSPVLPLERVAMMNFDLRRFSPRTESGHGLKRCHTRFKCAFSSSASAVTLDFASTSSSIVRWMSSILRNGASPLRTRSIAGR